MAVFGRFLGALLVSWLIWRLTGYALRDRVRAWRATAHALSFGIPVALAIVVDARGGGPGLLAAIAPYGVAQAVLLVLSLRRKASPRGSEGAPAR